MVYGPNEPLPNQSGTGQTLRVFLKRAATSALRIADKPTLKKVYHVPLRETDALFIILVSLISSGLPEKTY